MVESGHHPRKDPTPTHMLTQWRIMNNLIPILFLELLWCEWVDGAVVHILIELIYFVFIATRSLLLSLPHITYRVQGCDIS